MDKKLISDLVFYSNTLGCFTIVFAIASPLVGAPDWLTSTCVFVSVACFVFALIGNEISCRRRGPLEGR